jgi:hypothetical protein
MKFAGSSHRSGSPWIVNVFTRNIVPLGICKNHSGLFMRNKQWCWWIEAQCLHDYAPKILRFGRLRLIKPQLQHTPRSSRMDSSAAMAVPTLGLTKPNTVESPQVRVLSWNAHRRASCSLLMRRFNGCTSTCLGLCGTIRGGRPLALELPPWCSGCSRTRHHNRSF